MSEHVHDQRFDGDDPYLRCECGALWDALTGRPLNDLASAPTAVAIAVAGASDDRE